MVECQGKSSRDLMSQSLRFVIKHFAAHSSCQAAARREARSAVGLF